MSKTKEELNALKEEVETVSKKLTDLTDEELEKVAGGGDYFFRHCYKCGWDVICYSEADWIKHVKNFCGQ